MHDVLEPQPIPKGPASSTAQAAPWWHAALFMALLVGGSFFNAHQVRRLGLGLASHHIERYLFGMVGEAVIFLFAWWGLRLRRVSISELLGFRRGLRALAEDIGIALVFWVMTFALLAAVGVTLHLLHFRSGSTAVAALAPRTGLQMILWVALSCTAGFCEELAFRGYFLRQFSSPIHRLWLGVVGSSLIFGLSHAYEGSAGIIAIAIFGALLALLAVVRNSLRPGMIAHAWHDIFAGLVLALAQHFHVFR
jgi:membrane protease YdiL (CAAX protease family)